jgi:NAD-dependent dihydropyrimidine dehydrogenase PreA subunit
MRVDATFIGIEVADDHVEDGALAAKLEEVCPVDIYASEGGRVAVRQENVDECVLCRLCIDASPDGAVRVLKLYDNESALA